MHPELIKRHTLTTGNCEGNARSRPQICSASATAGGILEVYLPPVVGFIEELCVYSLSIVLLCGAAALLVGLAIGAMLGLRMSPQGQKNRDLENKLDQAIQDKKAYEDEVIEHFSNTAGLINKLTDSYRDVHNHLAAGATTLCKDQGPVSLEELSGPRTESEIPAHLADVQPPLDYAPKTNPDETGMLNEEFGLDRVKPEHADLEEPARH